jgi:hypothetical protein
MNIPQPATQYSKDVASRTKQAIEAEDVRNRKKGSDVELNGERLIIRSPNGTRYQVIAGDDGGISVAPAVPSGNASPSAWLTYAPVVTAATGSFTTVSATGRYKVFGKTVHVEIVVTITTNGTAGGRVDITLPVAATANTSAIFGLVSGGAAVNGIINGTGPSSVNVRKYDATYPGGDGNVIALTGTYEAA